MKVTILARLLCLFCCCSSCFPVSLGDEAAESDSSCQQHEKGYRRCLQANDSAGLSQALRLLHGGGGDGASFSVALILGPGCFRLSDNALLTFVNWSGVLVAGAGQEVTTLQCEVREDEEGRVWGDGGVGLVFRNSSNVIFRNLTVKGCGRGHNTTTVNITTVDPPLPHDDHQRQGQEKQTDPQQEWAGHAEVVEQGELDFIVANSAIYFESCSNVTFDTVAISGSHGVGVTLYNTPGNNTFSDCNFSNNFIRAYETHLLGGGGVVIETSHCVPGDEGCRDDHPSPPETSRSSYSFDQCNFTNNWATSDYLPFDSVYPHGRSHVGLGRGGGLAVSLKGRAYQNTVSLSSCTFMTNKAEWGGAFYLALGDTSVENVISIANSSFSLNNYRDGSDKDWGSNTVGGAVRIELVSYPPDPQLWPGYVSNVVGNSILFRDTSFRSNTATWGGALSFTATRNVPGQTSPNSLVLERCNFTSNQANVAASAVDIASWKPDVTATASSSSATIEGVEPFPRLTFRDCRFEENEMQFKNITDYPVGLGALYVSGMPADFAGSVEFSGNRGTGLVVAGTFVRALESCRAAFVGNSGRRGGALAFFGRAWLVAHEDVRFLFDGNAVGTYGLGGAVYSSHFGGHDLLYDHDCFFRYRLPTEPPSRWNTTFVFRNNTAEGRPNAIYATSSLPCAWHASERLNQPPYFRDDDGAFCETVTWRFEGAGRSCHNEVATGPREVNVNRSSIEVVPGWSQRLGITVRNDFGVPMPPVLLASPSREVDRSCIAVADTTMFVTDDNVVLYGRENATAYLMLNTQDPRVVASELRVRVRFCPPGFIPRPCNKSQSRASSSSGGGAVGDWGEEEEEEGEGEKMTCDCRCMENPPPGITCNDETKKAVLHRMNCMSYLHHRGFAVVANCPFNRERDIQLSDLTNEQLSKRVCGRYNRRGFLCSRCRQGYGVAVNKYSYTCVSCESHQRYSWALFLLLELGPITLVCFLVILFGVGMASPSLNALIFFSQIVSISFTTNVHVWFYGVQYLHDALAYPVFLLYGVSNLEFFRDVLPGICLHDGLKTLHILVINYVKALYPMLLLCLCCGCVTLYDRNVRVVRWLWRPFQLLRRALFRSAGRRRRQQQQRRPSLVDAFASLIILSYSKFMYVSFPLVTVISIYKLGGDDGGNKTSSSDDLAPLMLRYRYYFDPDEVLHHSRANVVYFILGVVVLVVFVGLPPIFLLLYPLRLTQACLGRLGSRLQIGLRTFAEAFLGAFRDGTGGGGGVPGKEGERRMGGRGRGRDCRWFGSVYLLLRIVFLSINTSNLEDVAAYLVRQVVLTLVIFLFALVRPYRQAFYNHLDTAAFVLLAILNALSFYNSHLAVVTGGNVNRFVFYLNYCLIFLPLLYLLALVVYKVTLWRGCGCCCFSRWGLGHRRKRLCLGMKRMPNRQTAAVLGAVAAGGPALPPKSY